MTQPTYTVEWLLPIIRRDVKVRGNFVYKTFKEQIWFALEKLNVAGVERIPHHRAHLGQVFEQIPPALQNAAAEAFWYLMRCGYIVPLAADNYGDNLNLHGYNVTERGLVWFDGGEPLPEGTAGYMKFLTDRVPNVDKVIEQYVIEALHAFNGQAYFAAAVMIGAASEKAIYLLAGDMVTALKPVQCKKLQDLLVERGAAKKVLDFILKVIERNKNMPSDGAVFQLTALFDAIRTERNAAVHPNTAEVSGDSVRLLTATFPYALSKSEELRAWLIAHPQSLD